VLTRRDFVRGSGLAVGALGLLRPSLASAAPAAEPTSPSFTPGDWTSVRAQFRLAPEWTHMSSFYIVSHPAPVREAIEFHRRALDADPFGYLERHMFEEDRDQLWRKVCAAAAGYIGGKPEEVALTHSTSEGLALLYNGLKLKPGQEILTTAHDHYVHHESIRLAVEKHGGATRRIALYDVGAPVTSDSIVARLRDAMTPAVRVVGVTWVHSSSGVRLPIRKIADAIAEANRGRAEADRVLLVVDGVHGFGAVDESVAGLGCDFFASGTHKWIFAPRGTGLVWGRPEAWGQVAPTVPSFMDFDAYVAWQDGKAPAGPTRASQFSPGGFTAFEHQWAAIEAFGFHERIGRARIAARIAELNSHIKDGLATMAHVTLHTPRDPALSAGINCFEVRGIAPADVVKKLLAKKVIASTSPYKVTYPRLAAGIMNTPEDVDRALAAVRALA